MRIFYITDNFLDKCQRLRLQWGYPVRWRHRYEETKCAVLCCAVSACKVTRAGWVESQAFDGKSATSSAISFSTSPGYTYPVTVYATGATSADSTREWKWNFGNNNDRPPQQTHISITFANSGAKDAAQAGTGYATAYSIFGWKTFASQYGTSISVTGTKTVTPIEANNAYPFYQALEARTENGVTNYYIKPAEKGDVGGRLHLWADYVPDGNGGWNALGTSSATTGANTITGSALAIIP